MPVQQQRIISTLPLEVINGGPWSVGSFPERDNTNFVVQVSKHILPEILDLEAIIS